MAIIPQRSLFSWREIDAASDLERLKLVLWVLPDEEFMGHLEARRGKGRNDYPVRAMWNALIAGVVFQHRSAAELLRELRRNRELAELCGFDPLRGAEGIPTEAAFSRFLKVVVEHREWIEGMFDKVLLELGRALPELGKELALDSEGVKSYGKPVRDERKRRKRDGRRELDADHGVKRYEGAGEDGRTWRKVVRWFGFKVHLLVDAKYEMPLAFEVTRASRSDVKEGERLMRKYKSRHPELVERGEVLSADRGYDSGKFKAELYDVYGIKPVIDHRMMWREERTRPVNEKRVDSFVYGENGEVCCVCPLSGKMRKMAFMGFEKDRKALKYRCPAAARGYQCAGRAICESGRKVGKLGRVIRIRLDRDRRIFTPIARHTNTWKRIYKSRSAVERVFSRLDRVFKLDDHTIRGKAKMQMRVGLSFLVLVCMALAKVRANQVEQMRSITKPLRKAA